MQIRLLADNFVNGSVPSPVKGEIRSVADDVGNHLVELGLAEALKIEAPAQTKKSSASQAAPASKKKTTKPSGKSQTKSSQSTTDGE